MIYLDYAATTPLDDRVYAAMQPYFKEQFGNPASAHAYGWRAEEAVEKARKQIAQAICAQAAEVIFTSGATEANNLALKGLAEAQGQGHIITAATEHSSVLESARALERRGFALSYLPVRADGQLELDTLADAIRADTFLVSIMWVNNETGFIQDIAGIAEICRQSGVFLHVDAAQALGKVAINLQEIPIDLLSLSAHKAYGPKGAGVLYKRRRTDLRLLAQMHGGAQEQGLRSGTLPTAQIIGMGEAAYLAALEREQDWQHAACLRQRLLSHLDLSYVQCNHQFDGAPHYVNLSLHGIVEENVLGLIERIACSNGSACASAYLASSHVLQAMGLDEALARRSLRLSFGRNTRMEDVDTAGAYLADLFAQLRKAAKKI